MEVSLRCVYTVVCFVIGGLCVLFVCLLLTCCLLPVLVVLANALEGWGCGGLLNYWIIMQVSLITTAG